MAVRTATSWDGTAGPRRSARATRPAGRAQPSGGGAGRSPRPPQPPRVPGRAAGSGASGGPRLHAPHWGGVARSAGSPRELPPLLLLLLLLLGWNLAAWARALAAWSRSGRAQPAEPASAEPGARPAPARPPRPPPRPGRGPRPALPGGGGGSRPPGALGRSRLRRRLRRSLPEPVEVRASPAGCTASQPPGRGGAERGGGRADGCGEGASVDATPRPVERGDRSELGVGHVPIPPPKYGPVGRPAGLGGEGAVSTRSYSTTSLLPFTPAHPSPPGPGAAGSRRPSRGQSLGQGDLGRESAQRSLSQWPVQNYRGGASSVSG